jgi:hypothetical protein
MVVVACLRRLVCFGCWQQAAFHGHGAVRGAAEVIDIIRDSMTHRDWHETWTTTVWFDHEQPIQQLIREPQ